MTTVILTIGGLSWRQSELIWRHADDDDFDDDDDDDDEGDDDDDDDEGDDDDDDVKYWVELRCI